MYEAVYFNLIQVSINRPRISLQAVKILVIVNSDSPFNSEGTKKFTSLNALAPYERTNHELYTLPTNPRTPTSTILYVPHYEAWIDQTDIYNHRLLSWKKKRERKREGSEQQPFHPQTNGLLNLLLLPNSPTALPTTSPPDHHRRRRHRNHHPAILVTPRNPTAVPPRLETIPLLHHARLARQRALHRRARLARNLRHEHGPHGVPAQRHRVPGRRAGAGAAGRGEHGAAGARGVGGRRCRVGGGGGEVEGDVGEAEGHGRGARVEARGGGGGEGEEFGGFYE